MYTPKHFQKHDTTELIRIIEQYPLGTLVCGLPNGELEANHIPFYIEQSDNKSYVLKGHIAKANSIWQSVATGSSSLTIFHGPDHYITPNWYPSKQQHGKVVPTWNYIAVHLQGEIHFIDDPQWKSTMLETLTEKSESTQATPWKISDAPKDFIERQLSGIVGLEIRITSMTGKWKISQNQSHSNQKGVISGLSLSQRSDASTMAQFITDEVISNP